MRNYYAGLKWKVVERMRDGYEAAEGEPRNFVFNYYKTKKEAQGIADQLNMMFQQYMATVEKEKS